MASRRFAGEYMMRDRPTVDHAHSKPYDAPAGCAACRRGCGRWRRSQAVPCPRNRLRSDRRTPYRPAMRTSRAAADKARARFAPCTRSVVERAIPLLQLPPRHAHARCPAGLAFRFVTPRRDPTPAMTITDKVGLQPLRQRMLARGELAPARSAAPRSLAMTTHRRVRARLLAPPHDQDRAHSRADVPPRPAPNPTPQWRQRPRGARLDQPAHRRAADGQACRDQDASPTNPGGRD